MEKTSDPESGSTVDPGDQVTYTLTVTNTTDNAVVDDAVVTDDLSDVLQYASLDSVPAGATLSGSTLTWNVPELAARRVGRAVLHRHGRRRRVRRLVRQRRHPRQRWECTSCTTTHQTPPAPDNPDNPDDPDKSNLPNTGGTSLVPLGLGAGFILAGVLALAESRRRRERTPVRIDPKR